MKSLTELWCQVYQDLAPQCDSSDARADLAYARRRVDEEGFSFLAITLPNFCSDFERSLELGFVSSDLFCGFRRRGGLPAFLSGFLRNIFDTRGRLLDSPDPSSVRSIRQLTQLFKKVEMDTTPERKLRAIQGYWETDTELEAIKLPLCSDLSSVFRVLFGPMLDRLDQRIADFSLVGNHGPGAVVEGFEGNEKFLLDDWSESLDSVLPFVGSVVPSWRYRKDVCLIPDEQVPPARVALVPKTLKGPRIIAIEPTSKQFAQQALWKEIPSTLKYCPFPAIIGFGDQEVNRNLAREGSISGHLATLDLSEASDRVHHELVQYLLADWPNVFDYVEASRSTHSVLPDGRIRELSKFASMGSALCFPVEAMVFATIIAFSVRHLGGPLDVGASIRVFGDDIVVPGEWNTSVVAGLESFGLKVNKTKSFSQGSFRESCGGDFFRGIDVTPIRVKHIPSRSHWRNATWLTNTASVQNRFFEAGMFRSASFLREWAEELTSCRLPKVNPWSAGSEVISYLCWFDEKTHRTVRTHPGRFSPQVRTLQLRSPEHEFRLEGVGALQKCLSGNWSDPMYREHLRRYGRGHVASMTRGWVDTSSSKV